MDEQQQAHTEEPGRAPEPVPAPASPLTPPPQPPVAPRRRNVRGALGMATALVLAFVWGGIADGPEEALERVHLIGGRAPARIRQDPHRYSGDALLLLSDHRFRTSERDAVRAEAEEREDLRTVTAQTALERLAAPNQILRREL